MIHGRDSSGHAFGYFQGGTVLPAQHLIFFYPRVFDDLSLDTIPLDALVQFVGKHAQKADVS